MADSARTCVSGQITDEQVTVTAEELATFCVSRQLFSTICLSADKCLPARVGTTTFVIWHCC
jgi:hypothetical protein